ncbi:uncharacterized protein LOC120173457 [Hibiscus syriacus]|uniref:uncharacterized protein LOC120173457 n=1 Tax=Hibiscus syriacus TaxID=106335 RepID=UPI0019241BFD|nr:uncharacterized protein LOC120173457 [Hibiscus syriacus]
MKPEMLLKIKEEVTKHIDAGFLQEEKYPEWVANIESVPKNDGKVHMCVDYRDLNKASPKDNFPLPHIDTLVDNNAGHSWFSFMNGFSGYNQIKMNPEDMEKMKFITMWGTFYYKVMTFGLKNIGLTDKYNPIFKLLKKNNPEVWNNKCHQALEVIKRLARWQILLSEFDIVYVSQKAIKGSVITHFLASRASEDYESLNFNFPDEDLMCISTEDESSEGNKSWILYFDGASNA